MAGNLAFGLDFMSGAPRSDGTRPSRRPGYFETSGAMRFRRRDMGRHAEIIAPWETGTASTPMPGASG